MPKFNVGDHVACTIGSDIRNHYVIAEILPPGGRVKDPSKYPGWSIRNHVNDSGENQYICPDPICGITFAFKESELRKIETK